MNGSDIIQSLLEHPKTSLSAVLLLVIIKNKILHLFQSSDIGTTIDYRNGVDKYHPQMGEKPPYIGNDDRFKDYYNL